MNTLWPPEHHAEQFHLDQKRLLRVKNKPTNIFIVTLLSAKLSCVVCVRFRKRTLLLLHHHVDPRSVDVRDWQHYVIVMFIIIIIISSRSSIMFSINIIAGGRSPYGPRQRTEQLRPEQSRRREPPDIICVHISIYLYLYIYIYRYR